VHFAIQERTPQNLFGGIVVGKSFGNFLAAGRERTVLDFQQASNAGQFLEYQRLTVTWRRRLLPLRKNSFTAWRTSAETGASDFFDSAVSARSC
jgi:hypothetical protein